MVSNYLCSVILCLMFLPAFSKNMFQGRNDEFLLLLKLPLNPNCLNLCSQINLLHSTEDSCFTRGWCF